MPFDGKIIQPKMCGNCYHRFRDPTTPVGQVMCRRFPPTLLAYVTHQSAPSAMSGSVIEVVDIKSYWPNMQSSARCGEWKEDEVDPRSTPES